MRRLPDGTWEVMVTDLPKCLRDRDDLAVIGHPRHLLSAHSQALAEEAAAEAGCVPDAFLEDKEWLKSVADRQEAGAYGGELQLARLAQMSYSRKKARERRREEART